MSRKSDREYKLCFHYGHHSQPKLTVTNTLDNLLCINHSIKGQIQYDVTNIDGAAAYIVGVYGFNDNSKVDLIHEESKQVIASWNFITLCYDSKVQVDASKAIINVKSVLKSLQVRGD